MNGLRKIATRVSWPALYAVLGAPLSVVIALTTGDMGIVAITLAITSVTAIILSFRGDNSE